MPVLLRSVLTGRIILAYPSSISCFTMQITVRINCRQILDITGRSLLVSSELGESKIAGTFRELVFLPLHIADGGFVR
jgi:hypothetical protein